ncbi:hypothetical protein E1B28_000351 [Marasmius oreades]|uniref:Organic hydroperoxide resistance protein n=1 Tax=Marasmius oreades TaxID=181124 RepID=A0A9P7V195_9AGAR|nr:uncharacterized protein E1B28_000351 [Marasmius oreades]KAG7098392.1 hypothetical protein E1B28_000351 [Marasmius oreades]
MFTAASCSALRAGARTFRPVTVTSSLLLRSYMTLKSTKYTVTATAQGSGRNGSVSSNGLNLNLALPKELGGTGNGENPEQLFAMGYAACFLGAIQAVAAQQGKKEMASRATVHATVAIGEPEGMPGFGLGVDIKVEGIDEELLKAGHEFCPYSRLGKEGILVRVSLA